jgi:thiamine biosynthesis lipoprotein
MRLYRTLFRAMASEHELKLWSDDEVRARRAADAARADVLRIEAKYSRYRDHSVTTRINRAAGGDAVAIDAETAALLSYADQCHRLSAGRFDITTGVLRRIWDFGRRPPRLPEPAAIAAATALIGWERVEWDDHCVRLPKAGMEIDFGGVGKEYAADRAAALCAEHGIRHGLVNLGGDVRAIGPLPDGTPWRVGIRHPRREEAAIATVLLASGAVATSGDYERFFEIAGQRYCHLLDPRTGRPTGYWQSVSVVAPLCVVAGTCATIAMLQDAGAEAFLRAQGLRYLAVDASGAVHAGGVDR